MTSILHGYKVLLVANPLINGFDLYLAREVGGQPHSFLQALTVTEVAYEDGQYGTKVEPFMRLSASQAQQFVEALSAQGVRPETASKTEGLLEAQRYHLEDLRQLLELNAHAPKVD